MSFHSPPYHLANSATSALNRWMLSRVKYDAASEPGGWRVLRYHRQSVVLNQTLIVGPLGMGGLSLAAGFPLHVEILCLIFTGLFVTGLLIERRRASRSTFSYSALGCYYVPAVGEPFAFGWDEIEAMEVARNEESCLLRLTGKRKICISAFMNGFGQFLDEAGRKF